MRKFYSAFLAALFISLVSVASNPFNISKQSLHLKEGDYLKGTVIIRLKPAARSVARSSSIDLGSVNEKLALLGGAVSKRFPQAEDVSNRRNSNNIQMVDLSLIYTVKFNDHTRVEDAIAILSADPAVMYAEPEYIHHFFYNPNDTDIVLQSYLTKIQAYAAWDSWKGDTNTVIGIIDSGTDPTHPDLAGNIKHNYADPIDGIDNDGDGFIDNFTGWDVSENDNDPTVASSIHGSHVSGCADAMTDNITGVASSGFKCKFLPVKASLNSSVSAIDNGYDGIVYAADHGCNIINMSWGRSGAPSLFEQDIINYAAINHDITALASAGNSHLEEDDYPASYKNVVSVGATLNNDVKVDFSNYGFNLDVCAPGNNIYSTVYPSSYAQLSGTSMSSPIAAGCAALIKSRFPSFTHEQVAEQLRITCDNIYQLSGNVQYANKLGKGRINMSHAVTDTLSPGVTAEVLSITDGNDDVFVGNDTLSIVVLFKNLLRPTANLVTQLTQSSNLYDTIIQSSFVAGVMNTMDTVSNYTAVYKVVVKQTAPVNFSTPFIVTMTDGTWSDFIGFYIKINVDYINIEINDIATSQTSKGRIGYNTKGPGEGLGFRYKGGPSNLYEMGLMISDGVHATSDALRNGTAGGFNEDFSYRARVSESSIPKADFYATGICNDSGPTATEPNPLVIEVPHYTYAWDTDPDRGYVIVEYVIRNLDVSPITNLYAGIFADWDINDLADTSLTVFYGFNKDSVDHARKMGISYNTWADGYYCGIKLLTNTAPFHHYAIDNLLGGNGGLDIFGDADYFSDADKFTAMSTDRDVAGNVNAGGNDICDVTATGPYSINPGDSITVAFALTCGEDLNSILNSADAAQLKYDSIHVGIEETMAAGGMLLAVYPNPAVKAASVAFSIPVSSAVELTLYNLLGEKAMTLLSKKLGPGLHTVNADLSTLPEGNYFIQLRADGKTELQKLMITR